MVESNKPRLSRDYISAIRAYWEWRPRTCLERLTTMLSLDTYKPETYHLYRLWIEVLANLGELSTLRSLIDHLAFYIENDRAHIERFSALKGLVHFELDEIEAARLIDLSLKGVSTDPYVWELRHLLDRRLSLKAPRANFKKHRHLLYDYFHLKTYALAALRFKDKEESTWAMRRINALYPQSPFCDLVQFHGLIDDKAFREAASVAKGLVDRFPLSVEFGFNYGYALAMNHDFARASIELGRINEFYPDEDIDVLNWLGFSLAHQAVQNNDLGIRKRALQVLRRSIDLSEVLGLPAEFPEREIQNMEGHFEDKSYDLERVRFWLCHVNQRQYHKFRTTNLRSFCVSLGKDAGPGDFCFVVADDRSSLTNRWRFGALYQVDGDGTWHPQHGFRHRLKLIDKPEFAVPLEIDEIGDRSRQVFELDHDAADQITQTILEYVGEATACEVYRTLRAAQ